MSAWRDIDTAPKDGTPILVWREGEQHVAQWFQWGADGEWGVSPPVPASMTRGYYGIGPRIITAKMGFAGPSMWLPLPPGPEVACP